MADWADFDGVGAGAVAGLAKWLQEVDKKLPLVHHLTAIVTSVIGAGICGGGAKEYVLWKHPDIPHGMVLVIASFAGLISAPLIQAAVGLGSVLIARAKQWIDYKFPPPPSSNGSATTTGIQPGPEQPKAG